MKGEKEGNEKERDKLRSVHRSSYLDGLVAIALVANKLLGSLLDDGKLVDGSRHL